MPGALFVLFISRFYLCSTYYISSDAMHYVRGDVLYPRVVSSSCISSGGHLPLPFSYPFAHVPQVYGNPSENNTEIAADEGSECDSNGWEG